MKRSLDSALVFQQGAGVVLDLYLVLQGADHSRNDLGHTAEPLEHIYAMNALVNQHAAAFRVPLAAPVQAVIVVLGSEHGT